MEPGLLRDALTLVVGLFTGVLSGAFGVGGGIISTPGIRLLGVGPLIAVGTTLPAVLPSAVSGGLRYRAEGLIDWRAVALTVPLGMAASVGGALLSGQVPGGGHLLQLMTAGLLGLSAWHTGRDSGDRGQDADAAAVDASADYDIAEETAAEDDDDGGDAADSAADAHAEVGAHAVAEQGHRPSSLRYAGVAVAAGGLSGLLGIGGGMVLVPGLNQVGGLPLRSALATSLVCVGAFAVPGTITHGLLGNIDWRVALLLAVTVIPGARLGAAASLRLRDRHLARVVAVFLGVVAVAYAIGELAALS
ncbi:MAG: sulfite exporter TauE/SafE family protein [Acidimicrobiales bacterium]